MKFLLLFSAYLLLTGVAAFSTSKPETARSSLSDSKREDLEKVSTSTCSPSDWIQSRRKPSRCSPCPNDEDDVDTLATLFSKDEESLATNKDKEMDRREAAFAMLGTLWATTTAMSQPANAIYGADAKIEMPNMVDTVAKRASGQCLVESLGNRECLVWMDPDNKLYQGADTQKLLQKIDASSVALGRIPELVEAKKWMGVKSIVAGPMGELLTTMNLLAPLSTQQPDRSSSLAKQVKLQIFAIDAAAATKDGNAVLKSYQGATDALVAFVQSL